MALDLVQEDENYIGLIDALSVKTELLLEEAKNHHALATAKRMLSLVKTHHEQEFLPMALNLCARCHLALNRVAMANKFGTDAVETARKARIPRDEGWALLTLALCEKASGNHSAFKKNMKASRTIADRVQDSFLVAILNQHMKECGLDDPLSLMFVLTFWFHSADSFWDRFLSALMMERNLKKPCPIFFCFCLLWGMGWYGENR